jgi:hypothetical protein
MTRNNFSPNTPLLNYCPSPWCRHLCPLVVP